MSERTSARGVLVAAGRGVGAGAFWRILGGLWAWLFLLAIIIFFSFTGRGFFSLINFQNIAIAASLTLLLAMGQTFVIISGGIDLSVGHVMGLSAVVAAIVMRGLHNLGSTPVNPEWGSVLRLLHSIGQSQGLVVAIGLVCGVLSGLVPGLVNGLIVSKLKVPPFIVTLGMFGIVKGSGLLASAGQAVYGAPPLLGRLGNGYLLYLIPDRRFSFFLPPTDLSREQIRTMTKILPTPVLFAFILFLICHFILSRTRFGQYTYAIGGNRDAAIRSGIRVDQHTILVYVFSAFLAAAAGAVWAGRFSSGSTIAGESGLLDSIAAVVIGGTSLFGGEGTVAGTLIGTLIIAVLQTGLVILNVQPFWQFIAVGCVIILAVLVSQSRRRVLRE